MNSIKYLDRGHVETFIFRNFLINQIRSGNNVTKEHNEKLEGIIKQYYEERPMVYISNRVYSYSVDPILYVHTSKITNIRAIAIVTESQIATMNAEFESKFYDKPFKVFSELADAIKWSKSVLSKEKKKLLEES